MITLQGIYDVSNFIPMQELVTKNRSKVDIHFFEPVQRSYEEELLDFAASTSFDFWYNDRDEREVNDISEK
jgi:hypothetical protein